MADHVNKSEKKFPPTFSHTTLRRYNISLLFPKSILHPPIDPPIFFDAFANDYAQLHSHSPNTLNTCPSP